MWAFVVWSSRERHFREGEKTKVLPESAVTVHFSPLGEGGLLRKFRRNGALLSAQEDAKSRWGLFVLSTSCWLFWVDFQTGKALYGLQGCREVG